jgi:hypothetical protein
MRIANDKINALEPSNFVRRALGVTTRDDDSRARVRAMNLTHRFPGLGIRRRRHRAGIQDYDIRACMFVYKRQPIREEIAAQSRGIRVCGATTKVFD